MNWTMQLTTAFTAILSLNGVGVGKATNARYEGVLDIHHARVASEQISRWDLPPRQRDVLSGILRGLSSEDIAEALHITEETVKIHLAALFARFGANTRADLATRAGGVSI